ncbi:MAG: indolepyruvate ferredoxin oxidoreductase subunit alpha [Christensenellales bacterium]|jgi:indolepyruvate ferredoxin oxidoreductase alpha subunit
MKELMLGNEAIARGAYEAGVTVVSSYPGTPSTEITECAAKYDEIYAEWAPNEKVALEVGLGAAIAGARTMCCMKHVGLNVAADPLFTASYTGMNAGLVIVVADDPGMHSSQNEQDSRYYAKAAHVPMLEASDSAECKFMVKRALELSEEYDTPVLLRVTTRIAHARSLVELCQREESPLKALETNPRKYVMMPGFAKARHVVVEQRENRLAADCNAFSDLNRLELLGKDLGVVCSGAAYQYVKEALPDASVLKLGMVYPLPLDLVRQLSEHVRELVVIEDGEPFFEEAIKAAGFAASGKEKTGVQGELFARKVAALFAGAPDPGPMETPNIPVRPPVLCPGCPHRGLFYTLHKLGVRVSADIGCYTLGAMPPLNAVDTVVCMGASIGMAHGGEKARGREFSEKTVAVIGDSTFLHSGITGLINAVYNESTGVVIIADNSTTGMTGHQENPATGKNLKGDIAPQVDLVNLCKSLGIHRVTVADPFDLKEFTALVKAELSADELSVIIARRPCALLKCVKPSPPLHVTDDCINCKACMKLGCPAITNPGDRPRIDPALCNGCGLCAKVCPKGAIQGGAAE